MVGQVIWGGRWRVCRQQRAGRGLRQLTPLLLSWRKPIGPHPKYLGAAWPGTPHQELPAHLHLLHSMPTREGPDRKGSDGDKAGVAVGPGKEPLSEWSAPRSAAWGGVSPDNLIIK